MQLQNATGLFPFLSLPLAFIAIPRMAQHRSSVFIHAAATYIGTFYALCKTFIFLLLHVHVHVYAIFISILFDYISEYICVSECEG